jgi:hypothetical protein
MAANMGLIAKKIPNTQIQIDSMCKISIRGLQEIRIKYRWQAIDQENEARKKEKKKFEPYVLTNGDTKQLLAKSYSYTKKIKVV